MKKWYGFRAASKHQATEETCICVLVCYHETDMKNGGLTEGEINIVEEA